MVKDHTHSERGIFLNIIMGDLSEPSKHPAYGSVSRHASLDFNSTEFFQY